VDHRVDGSLKDLKFVGDVKMTKKTSPTVRSLALLRKEGYSAQVTERYNPYAHVRIDLFGFIDVVAIRADVKGVVGVQTTSQSNASTRYHKILGIPEAKMWLEAGNQIIIHGWSKKGKKGKRKLWNANTREITLKDFK